MLDDTDIIGSGGFGTMYKLEMDNNNLFAVNKFEKCGVASNQIFKRLLEILGSIKHKNIVNLQCYYKSPSTKMLIYDFLLMGSLDEFIHGQYFKNQVNIFIDAIVCSHDLCLLIRFLILFRLKTTYFTFKLDGLIEYSTWSRSRPKLLAS